MANNSQSSKERTEQEVLSAIEEALNLRDLDAAPKQRPASATPAATPGGPPAPLPPIAPATPATTSAAAVSTNAQRIPRLPRVDEAIIEAAAGAANAQERRRAANDDRESIGQLLRALQRRPAG